MAAKQVLNTLSQREITTLANALARRLGLTETYDGKRNVWESCGYPAELTAEEMELRYKRMGIARTVVNAFPMACWRRPPAVYETDEDTETAFEKAWNALQKKQQVLMRLRQVDLLAGRGEFAVLLFGLDGGPELEQEPSPRSRLLYLRPYHPSKVKVAEREKDASSERYGLPVLYEIQRRQNEDSLPPIRVHWKRVLHVADGLDDRDDIGEHRLTAVWNDLLDIEKISAGGSEMFWKGGFPTTLLNIDKDLNPSEDEKAAMSAQVEEMLHGLTRVLRMRGVNATQLLPSLVSPENHFRMKVQQIAAATGIPTRILLGSEEAQLAGEQDSMNWLDRVDARRSDFCEQWILRPFVARCQLLGILPALPENVELKVEWPPIKDRTEKEQAEVGLLKTDMLVKYAATPAAEQVVTLFHFLTEFLHFTDEKAHAIEDAVNEAFEEEENLEAQAGAVIPGQGVQDQPSMNASRAGQVAPAAGQASARSGGAR